MFGFHAERARTSSERASNIVKRDQNALNEAGKQQKSEKK